MRLTNSVEQQRHNQKQHKYNMYKLKTNEQHGPHQKPGVDSGAPEE